MSLSEDQERAFRSIKASLAVENLKLSPEEEELVRDRFSKNMSQSEFLKQAKLLAKGSHSEIEYPIDEERIIIPEYVKKNIK